MEGLPERFGKYYVLGRLAQGGMAEVYRVKTIGIAGFEKIQALKRILPAFAQQPRFIRSFVDEARIAVELNHRNIVQVFDFGKAAGELYLAMELIDGVDLRTALRDGVARRVPMPLGLSLWGLGEVAAGLDYAHRRTDLQGRPLGIVHCDVSPQNIMLSREGFVKILDFGVARARFGISHRDRRLRGKPRYMAPEQARGEIPGPQADVFALGILAWEACAGRPLFDGADLPAILQRVRRADVPPLAPLAAPALPPELIAAIGRALEADPDARGSAADLGAALHHAARALETGGSRALAAWLDQLYPPADPEEATGVTAVDIPAGIREPASHDATTLVTRVEEIDSDLAAPPPAALTEKRRVVVVALLADPVAQEQASAEHEGQVAALTHLLADLAYKHGAVVHEQDAGALAVVFGLEIAGEDNLARALAFALGAVDAARGAGTEVSLRVAVRAGAVAQRGDLGYHLHGDAVDEARALARDATPGRPLLSGGTDRVTSAYYAFRELPARRHRSRRLRVLELLGPRSFDERDRALRERRGRFIGRTAELQLLGDALAAAQAGDRRVAVAITGRPGVGKSRLVAELVAAVGAGDAYSAATDSGALGRMGYRSTLVAVAATPAGQLAPFSLVTDLFQAALDLPPGHGDAARGRLAQRLRHVLARRGGDRDLIDEAVAAVEAATELRDGAAVAGSSPPDLRARLTAALHAFRAALLRPGASLIMVLEDLHLADPSSIEVLRASLDGPPQPGAELVLITSRPPGDDEDEPVGIDTATFDLRIEVGELPPAERDALVRDRLDDAATPEAIAAVARRAGGNPFLIEEVAAAVRELGPGAIPASAREVIVSRVDRLPASTKAVLQHAAVIGRTCRARILEELIGSEIHIELQELFDEGLLRRADDALDAEEGELAFSHGLIQEVLYDALAAGARRATHGKLGRLLASRYQAGREEPPATIANHLELGGEQAAAAAYWLRAGRVALAAHDAAAAAHAFTRTLQLDEASTEASSRATTGQRARRREALLGRERAHALLGDHAAQAEDLAAVEPLVAGVPRALADVRNRAAERLLRLGDYAAAVTATESAEQAAATAGDERLRGEALRLRAEAFERQGHYDRATAEVGRALEIFRRIGAAGDELRALTGLGRIHLIRADYEAASAAYAPILERVGDAGDPLLERIVHNHLAVIQVCLGQFEAAMASGQRAAAICRRLGDRAREGDNLSVCGIVLYEVGRWHDARDLFEQALAILGRTGSRWSRADCLVYSAANLARLGDIDSALVLVDEALALARDIGARYVEANGLVTRAGVLLARAATPAARPDDGERALQDATRAALTAREAGLVGPEIQGLSRQAQAMWRAGYLEAAVELSTRAVTLLERQKHLEGSEEEILYTHHQLLAAAGSPDAAAALEQARAGYQRKLAALTDPAWRASYAAIPLHAAIESAG